MTSKAGPDAPGDSIREWGRSLLWLNLLLAPVLFSTRTTESFELPKLLLLRAVAIAIAAGAGVVAFDRARTMDLGPWLGQTLRGLAREPIGLGIVLSIVAASISTLASMSPRTSLYGAHGSFAGLIALLSFGVLFFATRALCPDPASARTVLGGAVIGLGLSVAYAFVQLAGLDPFHWKAPVVFEGLARVFSTQGHPNSFAQLLAVALPVAAYALLRAARARASAETLVLGLVVTGTLGMALLTLSRAGALATGTALLVLVGGWALVSGAGRRRIVIVGGLTVVALVAAAGSLALLSDESGRRLVTIAGRLSGAGGSHALGDDPRRFLWMGAWAAFRDHPVAGVGLDCFSLAFGRYRTPASWSAEWAETPLKAHSQPLEVLATRGLIGAAAAAVLLFGLVRAVPRTRRGGDPFLGVAALAGLAAFAVHNLFHFPTAAGTSLAVTLAAILARKDDGSPSDAPANGSSPVARIASLPVRVVAALVAVGLLHFLVLRPLRADVLCRAGTAAMPTDPERALAYAREAVTLDSSRDLLWLRLAAAFQAAGRAEGEPARRRRLFEKARWTAAKAVRLVPIGAYSQAHLGTVLADLERETPPLATRAEVERAFERAQTLDPNNTEILMAAAAAALAAGDTPRATAWAETCARLYPAFAPPRALLGAVALAKGRELAAAGREDQARNAWRDAVVRLEESLSAEWHEDVAAREAAEVNLRSTRQALAGRD